MSNDHFSETTSTGWFSRLGSSIAGVLIGGLLVLVSIGVLWWNEGRSVATAKGLAEGAKVTVEAEAGTVDPAKDGKLVHVTGKTTLQGPAEDPLFGVTGPDLVKLHRVVEVFQWVEETKRTKRNKLGGGEETATEYNYTKKWDRKLHGSADFKHPGGHENKKPSVTTAEFQASDVRLGAFHVPEFLLAQWQDYKTHPLPDPKSLPESMRPSATLDGPWLVLSGTPSEPAVGDARVQFESLATGDASVLARQVKDTFEEYSTRQDTTIGRIASGIQSKEAMYAAAAAENNFKAWMFRLGGFVLMLVGFMSLFSPLKVLADVLPIAGKIVGAGTGLIAFLLSAIGSLAVIAIAWVFYRPLLGIALLAAAAAGIYAIRKAFKPKLPAIPPIPVG